MFSHFVPPLLVPLYLNLMLLKQLSSRSSFPLKYEFVGRSRWLKSAMSWFNYLLCPTNSYSSGKLIHLMRIFVGHNRWLNQLYLTICCVQQTRTRVGNSSSNWNLQDPLNVWWEVYLCHTPAPPVFCRVQPHKPWVPQASGAPSGWSPSLPSAMLSLHRGCGWSINSGACLVSRKTLIITACNSSCGKVMFSQVSVNLFMGGGYLWYQVPSRGVGIPMGDRYTQGVDRPRRG